MQDRMRQAMTYRKRAKLLWDQAQHERQDGPRRTMEQLARSWMRLAVQLEKREAGLEIRLANAKRTA